MNRRNFLRYGVIAAVGSAGIVGGPASSWLSGRNQILDKFVRERVFGLIPVVGDGKWVWTEPPADQTGYLEPRQFDLSVGVELKGTGPARLLKATTAAPVEMREQEIERAHIETQGCAASIRQLTAEAGQLVMAAPSIVAGQSIVAVAHYQLTLFKDYRGFDKEQFPVEQEFPKDFRKLYLYDSPGIQTRHKLVRETAAEIAGQLEHPWDKANAFYEWVWTEIKPHEQFYTSVVEALRDRIGDCEERAAVFVAFCRASGIPARLVWVPGHNWAEFYLQDHDGKGHWIPAHTSAYSWFGWTGAHEVVLQKGDSIPVPEKRKPLRLMADWMQWQGAQPEVNYFARLKPLASDSSDDPGPGARIKEGKGRWVTIGPHADEDYSRR